MDELEFAADDGDEGQVANAAPVEQAPFELAAIAQQEAGQVPFDQHPAELVKRGSGEIPKATVVGGPPLPLPPNAVTSQDQIAQLMARIAQLEAERRVEVPPPVAEPEPAPQIASPQLTRKEEIDLCINRKVAELGRGLSSDETEEVVMAVDARRDALRGVAYRPNKPDPKYAQPSTVKFPNKPPKPAQKRGWTA